VPVGVAGCAFGVVCVACPLGVTCALALVLAAKHTAPNTAVRRAQSLLLKARPP
jgi:hypothetical protein